MIFCMISKFRRWLMAMVVFLTMCAFAPARTQVGDGSKANAGQRAELVFDGRCLENISAKEGFEWHVPLDGKGNPVDALIYSVGGLNFKVKEPGCAKVYVKHADGARDANEVKRKETCCDSGH